MEVLFGDAGPRATPYPIAATMLLFFLRMLRSPAGGFVVLSHSDGMNAQPLQNSGLLAGVAISSWALVTALLIPVLGYFFDRGDIHSASGRWPASPFSEPSSGNRSAASPSSGRSFNRIFL